VDLRSRYDAWETKKPSGAFVNKRIRKTVPLLQRHLANLSAPPERLLDIGCGVGEVTLYLQQALHAHEAHGVDIAQSSVETAQRKGVRALIADLNTEDLPYEADHFDVIFAGEIIEHLFDPDHFLQEVHRILTARGVAVFTTPNLAAWFNRLILLLGWQPLKSGTSFNWDVGRPKFLTFGEKQHLRTYTLRAFQGLLRANGFRVTGTAGAPARENENWPHPWFLRPFFLLDDVIASVPSLAGSLIVAARRKE
jgi:2-polyprenyl-3-methyl-5-hydroxy-6-metoxy-1,4-benzoquinol methylase